MSGAAESLRLNASPEAVFAAIIDLARWGAWMPGHAGWPDGVPAPLEEGARFRQHAAQFGFHDTVTVTVTAHEPPSALTLAVEGNHGADVVFAFRVRPAPGGSVVGMEARIVGTLVPPLGMLARRGLKGSVKQGLRKFECHLSDGVSGVPPVYRSNRQK